MAVIVRNEYKDKVILSNEQVFDKIIYHYFV